MQEVMFRQFAEALAEEVRARADEISDETNTLYIGGGTPSVLPLYVFEHLLQVLEEVGHGGPYSEFTVEVNPEDIVEKGVDYVEGLLRLGVNRISMGVQSFDDSILKFMNRRHDADNARKAYSILEQAGVENISIDLIFGLPQLSDEQWKDTLNSALNISAKGEFPKHISAYQLSVEPGSMLARMVERGQWEEASEELCEHQYRMLCDVLRDAGYVHYEISNFALPGHEALHNSAYWRYIPYAGFGPGAHSFFSVIQDGSEGQVEKPSIRQWNAPDLKKYMENPTGVSESEELTSEQIIIEHIMLALRTAGGISEAYLLENGVAEAVQEAIRNGLLVRLPEGQVRIPEDRFFISDSIISEIV